MKTNPASKITPPLHFASRDEAAEYFHARGEHERIDACLHEKLNLGSITIGSLPTAPLPPLRKLIPAKQDSYDVTIYDGGCRYYYDFPEGVDEAVVQDVADAFLDGYDGSPGVKFEIIFASDERDWGAEVYYAQGDPDGEAEICDPRGFEADQWTC